MSTALTRPTETQAIESALISGDLSKLNPAERLNYYNHVCESLGLNPLTQPFAYITLNGKLQLYAKRDATEQLRKAHGVSITELEKVFRDDLYIVTAKAIDNTGRCDVSTGAVSIGGLKGEGLANAIMKAETKAKRRVTLSICGLGLLDETEVTSIPGAKTEDGAELWHDQEGRDRIVERKKAELQPPDEPATEADEIKRWKTVIGACKTAADFNAMIPQVKDKPNVIKMALMTASLEAGLAFDKAMKEFYMPEVEKPAPAPSNAKETLSREAVTDAQREHAALTSKIGREPKTISADPVHDPSVYTKGTNTITDKQRKKLFAMATEVGIGEIGLREICGKLDIEHISTMNQTQFDDVITELTNRKFGAGDIA